MSSVAVFIFVHCNHKTVKRVVTRELLDKNKGSHFRLRPTKFGKGREVTT